MLDFDGTRKARRREDAIAAGVFLLSLILFFLPAAYQAPIQRALRTSVLRPFITAQAALAGRRAQSVDVTEVRAQRDSLVALISALSTLSDEDKRLRELSGLRERAGPNFIAAEVLQLGIGPAESTFMLNVGRAEGVTVNSPVIAPEGLFGIIVEVDEHRSLGRDWTHSDFGASAMTVSGDAMGIVEVHRGASREEDLMVLNGAPFHVDIPRGTPVVTTGKGGIFPRGIPLGTVLGIEEADTGWRKSYLLRPAVRPERATQVLVRIGDEAQDLSQLWNVSAPVIVVKKRDTAAAPAAQRPRTRPARRDTTVRTDTQTIIPPPPTTTTGN